MAGAVIRPFRRDDTEPVVALWRAAGLVVPWNDPKGSGSVEDAASFTCQSPS